MGEKTVNYTRKTIEVAPGIKVICGGSVTEADSGHEYGEDCLLLITKRGTERLDSSPFIDLQSATLKGNEIVIKWTKLEERYEEKRRYGEIGYGGCEVEIDRWIEEVTVSRECEKRVSLY